MALLASRCPCNEAILCFCWRIRHLAGLKYSRSTQNAAHTSGSARNPIKSFGLPSKQRVLKLRHWNGMTGNRCAMLSLQYIDTTHLYMLYTIYVQLFPKVQHKYTKSIEIHKFYVGLRCSTLFILLTIHRYTIWPMCM